MGRGGGTQQSIADIGSNMAPLCALVWSPENENQQVLLLCGRANRKFVPYTLPYVVECTMNRPVWSGCVVAAGISGTDCGSVCTQYTSRLQGLLLLSAWRVLQVRLYSNVRLICQSTEHAEPFVKCASVCVVRQHTQ